MPYIGNSPGTGTRNRFIYTATASQTTFSGADDNGKTLKYADSDYVDVYLNGICLVPVTDYTSTSKTSIVLTQAASLNDTLEVVAYDIATISDTVSKADGGTFDGNVGFGTAPERQVHIAGNPAIMLMEDTGGGTDDKKVQIQVDSGVFEINSRNDDLSSQTDNIMCMEIDTGDVGIGTNAPNLGSSGQGLHIKGTTNKDGTLKLDSSTANYSGVLQFTENGTDQWRIGYDATNNHLEFTESGVADRMVIEDGGKIGIGVTDPDAVLDISGVNEGGNVLGILRVTQRASGAAAYGLDVGLDPTLGDPVFSRIVNDTTTESFRIQRSSGIVLYGGISTGISAGVQGIEASGPSGYIFTGKSSTNARTHLAFFNPNGSVGSITTTGSATTYSTSSDHRLKENVTDVTDGITRVKQLAPKRFNFIADADTTVDGFLAHEAQAVVPEAVTGTHNETEAIGNITDGEGNTVETGVVEPDTLEEGQTWTATGTQPVYQGIDQSKLVPLLTAALQEAIAKIEDLETRVAALEAG